MNLACSGAGILAINPAAVWCQTSTTAGACGGELHKTIQPLSLKGNISRPLKFMEIYENKYWSNEHGCIGFRWWYVTSGILWFGTQSSRSQWWIAGWTLSRPADTAETQSQADGWYTCDQYLAVAQQCHGQDMLLGLPIHYAWLHPDLKCLAEFLSLAVLYIQFGTSF